MRMSGVVVVLTGAVLFGVGCRKTAESTPNFSKAINAYYASRPACLFDQATQFPAQKKTKDNPQTAPYDALVDQGLLTRTTDEKKKLLILSEQVTNYDLSDKGRSAWTADQQQPGFGNFCYGTRTVQSVDSYTPTNDQPGATTTVNYHVGISGAPGWATAPETQNAFPQVRNDLLSSAGVATLTNSASGWAVTSGPAGNRRVSGADSTIVQ